MIDQLMFSLGNICGTDMSFRNLIKKYIDLPAIIFKMLQKIQKVPISFIPNFIFILYNLTYTSEDIESFTLD